jgi:hypothetical protein
VPFEHCVALLKALRKKFPAARGDALTESAEALFASWATFADWMGAVSLMRAVPTQRSYDIRSFTAAMCAWLCHEEDLFDALRSFSRLEGGGTRPIAEVLRLLAVGAGAEEAPTAAGAEAEP